MSLPHLHLTSPLSGRLSSYPWSSLFRPCHTQASFLRSLNCQRRRLDQQLHSQFLAHPPRFRIPATRQARLDPLPRSRLCCCIRRTMCRPSRVCSMPHRPCNSRQKGLRTCSSRSHQRSSLQPPRFLIRNRSRSPTTREHASAPHPELFR